MSFDLNKYLGTWYELAHRRNWFQPDAGRNTTAKYRILVDSGSRKVVSVANTTEVNGASHTSKGTATWLGGVSFHVTFPEMERMALSKTPGFGQPPSKLDGLSKINPGISQNESLRYEDDPMYPNYVIDRIWYGPDGEYLFAVVTDKDRRGLYLLSRTSHPNPIDLDGLTFYLEDRFGLDGLVWTDHD